ncbi:hypothetical protein B0H14DRAFT_3493064 [Mycena olivaceomarginata]|nr:hypothetical protein B0H14DRAFT_3493064 [Mycena olivaceomarginata]
MVGCEDDDGAQALKILTEGKAQFESSASISSTLISPVSNRPAQLTSAENKLMEAVKDLRDRRRISAASMPTFEDLVDPPEERDIGQLQFEFQNDAEIVAVVHHDQAVERGEVMEIDHDSDDKDSAPDMVTTDLLQLCQKLEKVCLSKGQPEQSMVLVKELRQFRA